VLTLLLKGRDYLVNKCFVRFVEGDEGLLDQIEALWVALNMHHLCLSPNFKPYYQGMTFEKRKVALLKKAALGKMRVDLAIDEEYGRTVGYCVSSITQEKVGEVDSIFVDSPHRGLGIGDSLIKKALRWMDMKGAVEKTVEVAVGNEAAFGFYARYGFSSRKTLLKQVRNSSST
jgi:diamine N-acetyltransferase